MSEEGVAAIVTLLVLVGCLAMIIAGIDINPNGTGPGTYAGAGVASEGTNAWQ